MVLDVRYFGRLCRFDEICGLMNCGPATRRKSRTGPRSTAFGNLRIQPLRNIGARHPADADLISADPERSHAAGTPGVSPPQNATIFEEGETMNQAATLFVSTFTTLLAIINPLESLPVFLKLRAAR